MTWRFSVQLRKKVLMLLILKLMNKEEQQVVSPLSPTSQWTRRYLSLLQVEPLRPGIEQLTRLVHAHVLAIPFENVTALLRRRNHPKGPVPAPDPMDLLEHWERRSGGGLCFEICTMLVQLLTALGYQAHIVLGQISLPNGHQAVHVKLDGASYLLDLGNGAPIFEAIRLGGPSVEVHRHGLSYRFRIGDEAHILFQDRMLDGKWSTHCRYDLRPASDVDRNSGYQHHHTPNASWMTGTLTMVRSTLGEVFALRDNTLSHYTAEGKTVETVTHPADFRRLADEVFGLPLLPVEDALQVRAQFSALAASTRAT
jgi:arylamine N-acetyltransferase